MTKNHNHIIFSYAFSAEGKPTKLNDDRIAEELKGQGLAWVHLDANHKSTKKWLEKEVGYLDHLIIDALIAQETRPRTMEFSNGMLVILRSVELNHDGEPQEMASLRIWVDSERIITIQRRDSKAIYDLCSQIDSGKTIKDSTEFLYNLLYQVLFNISPFLFALGKKVDGVEGKIMHSHDLKFREEILQIRTQATIFKRYLAPQKEAIARLRSSDCEWISQWSKRHFQENLDYISHMIDEIDEVSNRAQILHDELTHALTEKLNRNMFKLSVITTIFMPLTFITGIFGMNFRFIPGLDEENGFYICCIVMIAVTLTQIMFFRKKDLL